MFWVLLKRHLFIRSPPEGRFLSCFSWSRLVSWALKPGLCLEISWSRTRGWRSPEAGNEGFDSRAQAESRRDPAPSLSLEIFHWLNRLSWKLHRCNGGQSNEWNASVLFRPSFTHTFYLRHVFSFRLSFSSLCLAFLGEMNPAFSLFDCHTISRDGEKSIVIGLADTVNQRIVIG